MDIAKINQILTTGSVSLLSQEEQAYFDLMVMVRGLRMRHRTPEGKPMTTTAILRFLQEQYKISEWMARQVFNDAINFFYAIDDVSPKAWANFYAEKLENLAEVAVSMGNLKLAGMFYDKAAKLRGADKAAEIHAEMVEELPPPATVIYTTKAADLGLPEPDEAEIVEIIDSVPNIPQIVRDHLKEDAGVAKMNLKNRLLYDKKNFGDSDEGSGGSGD